MFNSLRLRLILSHAIPFLLVIPLTGIALVYFLENQIILPDLSAQLAGDARIITAVISAQPEILQDQRLAQYFLSGLHPRLSADVMILDPNGNMLASTNPTDIGRVDKIPIPNLTTNQQVNLFQSVYRFFQLKPDVINFFAPVTNQAGQIIGIVRLSYDFSTIFEEFSSLRTLILGILVAGMLLGIALGAMLALNTSKQIMQVAQAVNGLAIGNPRQTLPEKGPEEIKVLLHAVNFLVERLNTLEVSRKQLLSNLVHELGRPLGALRAGLAAVQRGAKDNPALLEELITGMDEEAARLQHLLEDLSHLYGQLSGSLELNRVALNLNEWLPKVLRPWQEAAQQKRLHWEENLPGNLPAIQADPDRLAQAIENLTSNAIKYTGAHGTIAISAGVSDHNVWIRVSDNGPGISFDEQDKVFEPYYRGNQGRRIKQGMGLGLSIAKDLVQAHGGKIDLDSAPGIGSKFTISLPADH
jgi:two-component system, OmpR family, sensor histidine kinase BaeS